jgi:ribosomal 30S subunit maturation factor RimM
MRTGGAALLVVADDSGGEQLIPLAAEIVVNIDKAARVILIDPPEGLLDL